MGWRCRPENTHHHLRRYRRRCRHNRQEIIEMATHNHQVHCNVKIVQSFRLENYIDYNSVHWIWVVWHDTNAETVASGAAYKV